MINGIKHIADRIKRGYQKLEEWKQAHPNCVGKVPNPFFYGQIDVYTSVESFESPYSYVTERSYKELGEKYAEWIENTQRRLINNRTKSERKFSDVLSHANTTVLEQPYFKINDKGYFLDFYLPAYGLAFELNGKIHKGDDNEWYDLSRDLDFHSIGIKTIRLSNLDIDTDDLKLKINEWANMAVYGNFDPSLYYSRANTRKFDGKETRFEKVHKELNKALSNSKYIGKTVLIVSTETYFCNVLCEKRYDTSENINKTHLDRFFDVIESNNIKVRVFFEGNLNNMSIGKQQRYIESNNNATKCKIDYVIRINGSKISEEKYKFEDVHPVMSKVSKNKDGEECLIGECPYNMFFPFKKNDARKRRYRKHRIIVNGNLCGLCSFNCGQSGMFTLCKGFVNNGTKNIYDNMQAKNKEQEMKVQKYLSYKETEEYDTIIRSLEMIDKQKNKTKINK